MLSHSWGRWAGDRAAALDEIENAHVMVGGTERGRRYATQQINYAYAALLYAHFQGFCRDLHTESVEQLVDGAAPAYRNLLRVEFTWNRSLSRGNPHPGAIGSDFNRFGFDFWTAVNAASVKTGRRRRRLLQDLMDWRNAIAHQDFDAVAPGGVVALRLERVRVWRRAVSGLAREFDQVMYNYLIGLLGRAPW